MLAQGWEAFSDCREWGIVFDGSRMGHPAEDVYVCGLDHPAASLSPWGPPMVICFKEGEMGRDGEHIYI